MYQQHFLYIIYILFLFLPPNAPPRRAGGFLYRALRYKRRRLRAPAPSCLLRVADITRVRSGSAFGSAAPLPRITPRNSAAARHMGLTRDAPPRAARVLPPHV